jgi:hypothetical protein
VRSDWQTCLYMCVMVDQREALAVTTGLTDTVYFGSPYWDSNRQPLGQYAATLHFANKPSGTWVHSLHIHTVSSGRIQRNVAT